MISNKRIVLIYILYLLFGIIYIDIIDSIFKTINVYYNSVFYLLIVFYIFLGINLYLNNKKIYIIIYYLYLIVFLFFRDTTSGINFDFYLFDWLEKIFKNKTIFLNIIGNILIFIPLGIIHKKNIIYPFIFVIIIELLQVILKKGIFDIVDIVLNYIGVSIGLIGVTLWMTIKKKKMKKNQI